MNVTITTIPEYGGILAGWTLILAVSKTTGRAPSEIEPAAPNPRFPRPRGSARPARRQATGCETQPEQVLSCWPAGSRPRPQEGRWRRYRLPVGTATSAPAPEPPETPQEILAATPRLGAATTALPANSPAPEATTTPSPEPPTPVPTLTSETPTPRPTPASTPTTTPSTSASAPQASEATPTGTLAGPTLSPALVTSTETSNPGSLAVGARETGW